jgi:very-short-patch-repair endonuclease
MKDKFIHNNSILKDRRRELRNNATPQEKILWVYLKSKKLGVKFLRQHSIGAYIVDFYSPLKKLIVEVDGNPHTANKEYDFERTQYLKGQGYMILRFWNNEIDHNLTSTLDTIQKYLTMN